MKRFISFVYLPLLASLVCCSRESWDGKIYKEQGVTVVENNGPGLWQKESAQPIRFLENLSLGSEQGEDHLVFYSELDVAVDRDLSIYILDIKNHRFLKFDKSGNFIWKAGRKGQGPGEFQWPRSVGVGPTGEIYVFDSPNQIHFFDDRGNYKRTVKLRGEAHALQVFPDGRFLLSIPLKGQLGVAAEYCSQEGEFLEKFPEEYRFGAKFSFAWGSWMGEHFQLLGGKIYLSLPDQYEIREYDLKGKLLRKIKRNIKLEPPEIKETGISFSIRMKDRSGPCSLYRSKMLVNRLLLFKGRSEKDYEMQFFLDFFNEKGQFLASYRLPELTWLSTIDSDGNFYFVQNEPFPRVIRSTLTLDIKTD